MATFEGTATSSTSIIPASQTDYPEYVDLSNLPAAFWSTVKDGGGDIRCYSDSSLTTELPREVVSCDTTAETGELHVKHNLSAGDTIYIDVDGLRSEPASTATYGAEAVWNSNYKAVYHMNDLTTSTIKDSTSNGNNGSKSSANNPLEITGKVGEAQETQVAGDNINAGSNASIDNIFSGGGAIGFWMDLSSFADLEGVGSPWPFAKNDASGWVIFSNSSRNMELYHNFSPGAGRWNAGSQQTLNTPEFWVISYDNSSDTNDPIYYLNGSPITVTNQASPSGSASSDAAGNLYMFSRNGGASNTSDAWMDEVFFMNTIPSADLVTTKYNNQNSPSTFRTWAEAATDVTGGTARRQLLMSL